MHRHSHHDTNDPNHGNRRKSNIEALRILAMLMILGCHFSVHGPFPEDVVGRASNRAFLCFLRLGGDIGVNVFVLITGYFLSAKEVSFFRLRRLYLSVLFYSVVPLLVLWATGPLTASAFELARCFLPVTMQQWWFTTHYFVLVILSTYLNRLIGALTEREFRRLVLLLFAFFVCLPTTLGHLLPGATQWFENRLVWFFVLYCFGSFLHKQGERAFHFSAVKALAIAAFSILVSGMLLAELRINFSGHQQLPTVVTSVFLFLACLKTKIADVPALNAIARSMFAVYLIHEHPLLRKPLWESFAFLTPFLDSPWFIPVTIGWLLIFFLLLVAIDIICRILARLALTTVSERMHVKC